MSCECCWSDRGFEPGPDAYYEAMKRHELRGCICTLSGMEADKARAGQFWVDGRDTRVDAVEGDR